METNEIASIFTGPARYVKPKCLDGHLLSPLLSRLLLLLLFSTLVQIHADLPDVLSPLGSWALAVFPDQKILPVHPHSSLSHLSQNLLQCYHLVGLTGSLATLLEITAHPP